MQNPDMKNLEVIQTETGDSPDSAIIWLHGLGADGHDFAPIVPKLNLPADLATRFIFPHAPVRPITINQGYQMPGWYDISSIDIISTEDESGIRETSDTITQMCQQQEALGIDSKRIILAGFSQGGAIALHSGLRYPSPLAGIMALSTYLPLHTCLNDEAHETNHATSIFMAHGLQDDVVSARFGKQSAQLLKQAGYPLEWHEYQMPHSVCEQEITDIGQWITSRLS